MTKSITLVHIDFRKGATLEIGAVLGEKLLTNQKKHHYKIITFFTSIRT